MPDDLPAADADRREDSDLSASALQKIYDIVIRQVSLAMNSMNRRAPGPVPATSTDAATTATATTASASQAQTVCMPQTQCSPVTSAFVPLSTFNIISAADFDVTTSFRSGCSFLLSVTVSLCLPSPFLYGDVWGYPLFSGIRPPPHPPLLLSRGWLDFRGPDCNPHPAIPLPVRVPTTGPRLRSFVVDAV